MTLEVRGQSMKTKYLYLTPIAFAVLLAISPTVSRAQVEVGHGGVTVGPHHDSGDGHGHGGPVVHGDNDHGVEAHGQGHGNPAVVIQGDHGDHGGGHPSDHNSDRREDRH